MLVASFCLFVGVQFMFEYRSVKFRIFSLRGLTLYPTARRKREGVSSGIAERIIRVHHSVNLSRIRISSKNEK